MNVSWKVAGLWIAGAVVVAGCQRSALPRVELTEPAPAEPELPPVDVDRLLAREGLLHEPDADRCCGEGRVTLERTLWVELDGQAPPELVLELMEYIGEGGASWHYHAFDARDPARPKRIEPALQDGGYMHYSYMEVTDLDADGVDELMLVGEIRDTAPLRIYVMRAGALELVTTSPDQAQVYLPFDHDGGGKMALAGLKSASLDGDEPVDVRVLLAPSGERHRRPREVKTWLPELATATLTRERLPHVEPTLTLLTRALDDRNLGVSDPARVIDATLGRLEAEELGVHASQYVAATRGEATKAQRERLSALMKVDGSERSGLAATLWLRTSSGAERAHALAWAERSLGWWVRTPDEDLRLHMGAFIGDLDEDELGRLCALTGSLLTDGGATPERLGQVVWDYWKEMQCVREVVDVLESEDQHTRQVVRGALNAYSWVSTSTPDLVARYARLEPEIIAALTGLLRDPDVTIRAEAARAMAGLDGTVQTLRDALEAELDHEVKRSLMIALADAEDPGDPALFLRLLGEPQSGEVTRQLHGELARADNLEVLARGLEIARSQDAYDAYEWRLVYRHETLGEAARQMIARDAFTRLEDANPRVRQSACAILTKEPYMKGDTGALERVIEKDDTSWVRSGCAEALRVMLPGIGPM